ncbi:YfbM family protein [Listeria newyorkensis]|uniref:YfbM family protein n=2 Tax=Listeria newyorkensis TaxID=1497681 RepID=A0A841YS63_9LIST|nr:YfbM family protein [Listeria newyorkensis]
MGMIGNYCKITPDQFHSLKNGQVAVSEFLYSDNHVLEDDLLDIDKAWDCIHFALTGKGTADLVEPELEMSPMYQIIMGGQDISDEDIGYGSARYLTPKEVKACHQTIEHITEHDFKTRVTAEQLVEHQIYPLSDQANEDFIPYAYEYFRDVQAFFEQADTEEKYMLLYIN